MKESDLIKKIRDHLKLSGIECIKHHGSIFSEAGVSDLICVIPPSGKALYIECKIKGNKPTEIQKAFVQKVANLGAIAGVVYSVEDVEKLIHSPS